MTAVSAFGSAEFDEVRHQVFLVQRLETAPRFWSLALQAAVKPLALFTIKAANAVTDWACGCLERKAVRMETSNKWFREQHEAFCLRIVTGPTVPSERFIRQMQAARKESRYYAKVCRTNIQKRKGLSVSNDRLIRAYESLVRASLATDLELAWYENTALAARRSERALVRTYELSADIERSLANFNEDDPLMDDPEIHAAAVAAAQRIQERIVALPAN
ncbi:hypothetical protein PMI15_04061 [Polaromonas sp. CF318]|uniref:hypothetical protein n=1 Tax=Polaromonas sp. CF318 TaxID=1144318 RepID=UPI0002713D76|nr:hypothetical protein [Polaromonas sp. CF318]EJL79073.1 hypothetical protein PMI15_04061 [Polaromonas sp. CF318]